MKIDKKIKKTFTLQKDQTDCGAACLLSLVRYYGGDVPPETLRQKSGTSVTGTTLLGLYQAARETGFDAEGCQADIKSLAEHGAPVILHTILDEKFEHYVIFYHSTNPDNSEFLIGNPAFGIEIWNRKKLETAWKSRTCLTLSPNENFRKKGKNQKINFIIFALLNLI